MLALSKCQTTAFHEHATTDSFSIMPSQVAPSMGFSTLISSLNKGLSQATYSEPRTTSYLPATFLEELRCYQRENNQAAFISRVELIDWTKQPATTLRQTIDLALSLDLTALARNLAQKGQHLFPNEVDIQRLNRVLAPPVILGTRPAKVRNLKTSYQWLREHGVAYHGRWVAVQEGHLLGVADTLDQLKQLVNVANRENILFTKVL